MGTGQPSAETTPSRIGEVEALVSAGTSQKQSSDAITETGNGVICVGTDGKQKEMDIFISTDQPKPQRVDVPNLALTDGLKQLLGISSPSHERGLSGGQAAQSESGSAGDPLQHEQSSGTAFAGEDSLVQMSWDLMPDFVQVAAAWMKLGFCLKAWDTFQWCQSYFVGWACLDDEQRQFAHSVGFHQESWDLTWDLLPADKQVAATQLGFTPNVWLQIRAPVFAWYWWPPSRFIVWQCLDKVQRQSAQVLGYHQESWDSVIVSCPLYLCHPWKMVDDVRKRSVQAMGFNEQSWNFVVEKLLLSRVILLEQGTSLPRMALALKLKEQVESEPLAAASLKMLPKEERDQCFGNKILHLTMILNGTCATKITGMLLGLEVTTRPVNDRAACLEHAPLGAMTLISHRRLLALLCPLVPSRLYERSIRWEDDS